MINKIGLGTVQFGLDYGISNKKGITELEEVRNIISCAKDIGIDLLDTAYGYGKSEEVLGSAGVNSFKIVTKFLPATPEISIPLQINSSLQKLNIQHLYGILAHRSLDVLNNPDIWNYLLKLKQDKIVDKIGFSFNTPEEADVILSKGFVPDLIQVPFNYLDNRFKKHMIEFKKGGCEIHVRSPFLQGLFFINPITLSDFFEEVKPIIIKLQKHGNALSGLLLKYCLEKPFIDKVIFGINNKKQLLSNIEAIQTKENLTKLEFNIKHEILTPSNWPK